MTWIDFLWPMVAGACMTMGVIHLRIGLRRKPPAAHLLFALNAFVGAVYSCLEHALTRADSPARYLAVLRWMDIVGGGLLVASLTAFVWAFFGSGRKWLAFLAPGVIAGCREHRASGIQHFPITPTEQIDRHNQNQTEPTMKNTLNTLRAFSAIAVLAFTAGCATDTQDKESALIAAGFKSVVPSTPEQVAKLKSLPEGKVTMVQKKGITYYVFPDVPNNRAFVGTPIEYQAYQQQRQAQKLADEQLMAASMYNQQMNFEAWNGWGPGFVGPAYAPGPRMMPPPPRPPMGGFRR